MASASTHSVSITSEASAFSRDGESSDTEDDALDEIRQEEGGVVVVEELVQIQQNLPLEWHMALNSSHWQELELAFKKKNKNKDVYGR